MHQTIRMVEVEESLRATCTQSVSGANWYVSRHSLLQILFNSCVDQERIQDQNKIEYQQIRRYPSTQIRGKEGQGEEKESSIA